MKNIASMTVLFIFLSPLLMYAAPPITRTDEIIVTARRFPQSSSQLPDNITVITAKELALMPVNNLPDALNKVTGIDMQSRGPFGTQSSVSIQGCHPRQVRIMVDGVLLDAQGRDIPDLSQLPLENIERVEIIKGTGSSVWGSSLGGVINIITKSPQTDRPFQSILTLSSGWDAYGFQKQNLEVSGKVNEFRYLFWVSNLNTNDEFRPNSETENQKASGKFSYQTSEQTFLEGAFHYNGADIGGFEFPTYGFGEDYFYNTRYGSLKFSYLHSETLGFNGTVKFSDQDTRLKQFSVPGNITTAKVATENIFTGLDLQANLGISEAQSVLLGTDLGKDQLNSDQMAGKERLSRNGYYINYNSLIAEKFSLTLSGRYDDNSAYGEQFSPSAGVVYHIAEGTNLRASVARAFNAPPLLFKYISGNPYVLPNSDLKAERAIVYELSADTQILPSFWLKVTPFRAEVEDFVNIVGIAPWTYQAQNVSKIRRQGFETEARYALNKELTLEAGTAFNRVIDRSNNRPIQGNGVAKLTYNMGLNYAMTNDINLNLNGQYRFWDQPVGANPKDRLFIWDARLNYTSSPQTSLFISIYNLQDRKYYYDELLPLPGRMIEAGLKYGF